MPTSRCACTQEKQNATKLYRHSYPLTKYVIYPLRHPTSIYSCTYREKLMLRMRRMVGRKRIFFKNMKRPVLGGAMEEQTKGGNEASIVVAKHTTKTNLAHKPATRLVMSFLPSSGGRWAICSDSIEPWH
jgi:hypothetical protein